MRPFPVQSRAVGDCGSFSSFPVEILTVVFCHLPSFDDVLNLSSTCRQMRDVWSNSVATIYKHVVRASIPCERHARFLLADQGGSAPESEITATQDVVRMMRNMHVTETAILQFEDQIVRRVKARGHRTEDYYGAGALQHPPYLTRTERPRFIRSYYQYWGLLTINNTTEWHSRLQSTSLKQLIRLCEISWLPDDIRPGEGAASFRRDQDDGPDSKTALTDQRSQASEELSKMVSEQTERMYRRLHGQDMGLIWAYAIGEGYMNFLVMWDHWQSSLKEVVCARRMKEPPYKKVFHWELWEDSSDEEQQQQRPTTS